MRQFKILIFFSLVIFLNGYGKENSNKPTSTKLNDNEDITCIEGYKIKSVSNGKIDQFTYGEELQKAFIIKKPNKKESIIASISFEVISSADSFPVQLSFYTNSESGPIKLIGKLDKIFFKTKVKYIGEVPIGKNKTQLIRFNLSKLNLNIPNEGLFIVVNSSQVYFQLSKKGASWWHPYNNDIWKCQDPHLTLSYVVSMFIKK